MRHWSIGGSCEQWLSQYPMNSHEAQAQGHSNQSCCFVGKWTGHTHIAAEITWKIYHVYINWWNLSWTAPGSILGLSKEWEEMTPNAYGEPSFRFWSIWKQKMAYFSETSHWHYIGARTRWKLFYTLGGCSPFTVRCPPLSGP